MLPFGVHCTALSVLRECRFQYINILVVLDSYLGSLEARYLVHWAVKTEEHDSAIC